ncbi:MAG: hypothetical protein ABI837_11235, partial [Acidobacteriota bacterium]
SPGALFKGTLPGGGDMTLYLTRVGAPGGGSGSVLGMMFERRTGTWRILDSVAVRGTNLSFSRIGTGGTREVFTATLSGSRLTGLGGGQAWTAERDPFFGTWRRNEEPSDDFDPTHIHVRALEGDNEPARGKSLSGGFNARWFEMFVTFPGSSRIHLQIGGGVFDGTLDSGGRLTGSLTSLVRSSVQASWTRLPDSCGL